MVYKKIHTNKAQWVEEDQQNEPEARVLQTCRNFQKIYEWAREYSLPGGIQVDLKYREMNDPLDPSTWTQGYSG